MFIKILFLKYIKKELLTSKRLKFIFKNKCKYLKINSTLIKQLLKEDNFELLDIIFNNIIILNLL